MVIRSYGSRVSPSTSCSSTSGRETVSSNPSRRICSISTASWSSPRPRTSNASLDSEGRTSIETLPRTSRSRRALIWRLVTYLPSRPDSGDVFTPNVIRSVGASTSSRGSGRGSAGSVSVSPIVTSGRPATDTMSPGPASSMSTRSMPWAVWRLVTVPLSVTVRPGSTACRVVGLLADDRDPLPDAQRAVPDAPDRHPPDVVVGGQVRDEQLERVARLVAGRRGDLDEQVEQRVEVRARLGEVARGGAGLGVRVDDRELDLVLVRAEVHEQLVDLVEDLGRACIRAVDLVDRHDDRQPARHRLLEHVAGLRQRALGGIHEEQHRIDHQQAALDLPAEVGVAGRVDDVEARPAVVDGRLLGEDRDPLLALQVARVEHALDHGLVRAEGAGLPQHRVDQRGLAVVDVGHDGDVAQVGAGRGRGRGRGHGGTGIERHGSANRRTQRAQAPATRLLRSTR